MIDEKFLQSAVRIRRTYLKLSNNLELYKSATIGISKKLDSTLEDLKNLEDDYVERKVEGKETLEKLLKVIDSVEEEGRRLEKLVEPINSEIEKLVKEEQELYRQITSTHHNLSEDQIVKEVKDRLIKEGLS